VLGDALASDGTLDRIYEALYLKCREQAAIIDSQSAAETAVMGPLPIKAASPAAFQSARPRSGKPQP
jgi:hypothetical protein